MFFLADNTGSMGSHIAKVKAKATTILDELIKSTKKDGIDIAFGVGFYKSDPSESCGEEHYKITQKLTKNKKDVTSAINNWGAGGGCDWPEANFYALTATANNAKDVGWRDKLGRVIVTLGDAESHTTTITEKAVTDALINNDIAVIFLDAGVFTSSYGTQAEEISKKVKGSAHFKINSSSATELSDKIIESINSYVEERQCKS